MEVISNQSSRSDQGSGRMKIARTFTIDHHLYLKLKETSNQSLTICKALNQYFSDREGTDVRDASTMWLIKELSQRDELDNVMRKMCEFILANGL